MGIFSFGRKDANERSAISSENVPGSNDSADVRASGGDGQDREELMCRVAALEGTLGENPSVEQLNELGGMYLKLDDVDRAIVCFERSMALRKQMGRASTSLVKLYNKKRAAAARNKDDEAIAHWFAKAQEMLQISKDVLRGNG